MRCQADDQHTCGQLLTYSVTTRSEALAPWSYIISPLQLLDYLGRPAEHRVVVVDLSPRDVFDAGHIQGAHWLEAGRSKTLPPFPGKLPELDQLTAIVSALDLYTGDHIVVMDAEGGGWAGRFVWLMLSIGFPHVHALDGGRIAWEALDMPLTRDDSGADAYDGDPSARGERFRFDAESVARESALYSVDLPQLKKLLEDPATESIVQIWDARSAEEYSGQRATAKYPGHIQGARHLEWLQLLDPQNHYRLRSREDLLKSLAQAGLDANQPLITHCQTHHRSGLTFLAGLQLGLDIKAYPGSWVEWGNSEDTKSLIETGPASNAQA